METAYWMLTDWLAFTGMPGKRQLRWGLRCRHGGLGVRSVRGYACRTVHLPYLLDPLYERYGVHSRLWLCEAAAPNPVERCRVTAREWTVVKEVERPAWVGRDADLRVRLRFALLAAATSTERKDLQRLLDFASFNSLDEVVPWIRALQGFPAAGRRPCCPVSMASHAVLSVAMSLHSGAGPVQAVGNLYPEFAWYAARAAAAVDADLDELADAAVCREAVAESGLR
jgi:hypothetical protein